MVCKVAPDDEAMASSTESAEVPQACILVKDVVRSPSNSSEIFWLVGTVTVSHLFRRISESAKFSTGNFELVFEHPSTGKTRLLSECMEMTLKQAGFVCDGGKTKNKLFVTNTDTESVTNKDEEILPDTEEEPENVTFASFTLSLKPEPAKAERVLPIESSDDKETETSAASADWQFTFPLGKQEIKFTGLVNQAMTCYLNSLVQTLYMTPEFRNALYRWRFDGSEEEQTKSIPFQLQKLFLQLQTSEKSAVGTTCLTRSFGWDSSEAWQQHDIQELCRVMFDALEHKFKNTEEADLISRLYEGKMIDYVRCLECSTEKAREDTFLDIPLPVRPFGSQTSYGSVEEALKAFVMPETLDGNNQYWCERCNKKCDAHKGLKFSRFPYLLTLHLKRFDFDYNTLHRIKLNDKVTFPEILDLNPLISGEDSEKQKDSHDAGNEDSLSEVSEPSAANSTTGTESQEDDEGIDVGTEGGASTVSGTSDSSKGTPNLKSRCSKSGFVYELFSIMIHSGSASGGHYYAYIKDFTSHQWYCFNDQNVSPITYDDIRRTYGGGPSRSSGYYSTAYTSSANAYMLMYRKVDKEKNAEFVIPGDFPVHISSLLDRLKDEEITAKDAEEKERNTCKIQLYCRHPKRGKFDLPLKLHKDTTLGQATSIAYEKIGDLKQLGIPLERCRLVKYNDFYDTVDCSWDDQNDESVHQVFGGVRSTYKFDLLLEIVAEGEQFQTYTPGCASVRLLHVQVEEEELNVVESVRISVNSSVSDLKHKVIELLSLRPDFGPSQIHIVLIKFTNDLRLLEDDEASLQSAGFRRTEKIYVTSSERSGWTPMFKQKFYDLIERFEHSVTLVVNLPDVRKETLERLGIDTNATRPAVRPVSPVDSLSPDCGFEDSLSRLEKERALSEGEDDEEGRVEYKELDNEEVASAFSEPEEGGEVSFPDQNVASASTSASASEDSSLSLTDSDRTLLGDPPEGIPDVEDDADEVKLPKRRNAMVQEEPYKYFFMVLSTQDLNERGKLCSILADKRIPLTHFKMQLEALLEVPADFLLVYKKTAVSGFSSISEREWASPSETLEALGDDPEVVVRLGRALRPGEVRGKIYLLDVSDTVEKSRLLFDWILSPESTVGQVKQHIIAEAKASCGLDIPYEKCVLRRKNWRTPSTVYGDETDTFGSELMYIFKNWEMYLQILDQTDPEDVCSAFKGAEITVFCRQWNPDTLTLGPFVNVPLKECSRKEFAAFLEWKYTVAAEFIEITKASGNFPADMSVLSIHESLTWFPILDDSSDTKWPCNIQSDGDVVLWRDKRVPLKKLTDQERKDILLSENGESAVPSATYSTYTSPRRERGLKIYLDTPTGIKDDIDID